MPLVSSSVYEDHIIRERIVMIDDVGQVDIGFSTLIPEDGVVGLSIVDNVVIDLPVRKLPVHPSCVFLLDAGNDDRFAVATVGSAVRVFRELPL